VIKIAYWKRKGKAKTKTLRLKKKGTTTKYRTGKRGRNVSKRKVGHKNLTDKTAKKYGHPHKKGTKGMTVSTAYGKRINLAHVNTTDKARRVEHHRLPKGHTLRKKRK
jgi:hypothetical protein